MTFSAPNKYRIRTGHHGTDDSYGQNGAFRVQTRPGEPPLTIIASDQLGWEHVSVSRPDRIPTWSEMCAVKALFWSDDDCVMQLHPPKSDWVDNHPRCLHLWRPVDAEIPLPPSMMVGDASLGRLV